MTFPAVRRATMQTNQTGRLDLRYQMNNKKPADDHPARPAGNAGRAAPYRNAGATLALSDTTRISTHAAELMTVRGACGADPAAPGKQARAAPHRALRLDSVVGSGKGVVPVGGDAFRWGAAAGPGVAAQGDALNFRKLFAAAFAVVALSSAAEPEQVGCPPATYSQPVSRPHPHGVCGRPASRRAGRSQLLWRCWACRSSPVVALSSWSRLRPRHRQCLWASVRPAESNWSVGRTRPGPGGFYGQIRHRHLLLL